MCRAFLVLSLYVCRRFNLHDDHSNVRHVAGSARSIRRPCADDPPVIIECWNVSAELLPGWAQAIHPWLPMTYTIQGIRYVISSGQYADMWHQVGYLSIYLVAAIVFICVYFLKRKKNDREDEVLMPVKV